MPKSTDLLPYFDAFWNHVADAEIEIRQYGHLGRLPPDYYCDPWDEKFAQAYEAIRLYLGKFRKERLFKVPAGLMFCPRPIKAGDAHEALMFFLNPPAQLFGEPRVLDSKEYVAIKEAAMAELDQVSNAQAKRSRAPTRSSKSAANSGEFSDDALELLAFLMVHHGCESDEPHFEPVPNQDYLVEQPSKPHDPWYQARVSRALNEIMEDVRAFGHVTPMARYRRLCNSQQICRELLRISLKRLEKGLRREFGVERLDDFDDRGF